MSGSDLLAERFAQGLDNAGVQVLFGLPGGGNNLDVIGACQAKGIRFVLCHGETAAALMGSAYAELAGVPGAAIVTRGPGAASAVNGVAHALLDRLPLALVTDDVPVADARRISHQRLDLDRLYDPVTKWSGTVGLDGADETISSVLSLSVSPAPGPIRLGFDPAASRPTSPHRPVNATQGSLEELRITLRTARAPVFLLGLGARKAIEPLRRLLEGKPWPVLTTYKAKGIVPEVWPNAAGLLTGGTMEAATLHAADTIIAIGLDPVELIPAPWPYRAKMIAVSEWSLEDPYFVPSLELVLPLEDAVAAIDEFLAVAADEPSEGRNRRIEWTSRLRGNGRGLSPFDVVAEARAAAPTGTTATVDAGAHMLLAMPVWEVGEPGEISISSGLATMGYALPAAIAASLARPGGRTICFTGDAGLGMALAELETVARLELPLTIVVFNDAQLSLIQIKQRPVGHGGTEAVAYGNASFAQIAGGYGIASMRSTTTTELREAFAVALATPGPFLIDAMVDASSYRNALQATRGGNP